MTETGTPLTEKNCMLASLFSCLVPKNMKKICKTLYGCETWSYLLDLTRERNYSDAVVVQGRKENCQGAGENYILSNL
jgi:hypothetical protein